MKHISFPSIGQFANVVKDVLHQYNYIGKDADGNAIYDISRPKPVLSFRFTTKLHGTNGACAYNDKDGMWVQSRTEIITAQHDNAGCAFFCEVRKDAWVKLFQQVKDKYNIDTSIYTIAIYFEFVGKKIQSKVAISEIEKAAFIIGVKIAKPDDVEFENYWIDSSFLRDKENRIFNIEDYKTYELEIDFNHPQLVQNQIIEWTLEVENECPVGKEFGISGVGEGIVGKYRNENGRQLLMKSKGIKHSGSKVKALRPVDDAKINRIIHVVEKVAPEWRLEQMLQETFDTLNGGQIDRAKLGDYIRKVINDILKEEMHVIAEFELEPKDINSQVSSVARKYFFNKENGQSGLAPTPEIK